MSKVKSKFVRVILQSIVTKHTIVYNKPRVLDPLEVLRWDPMLQAPCIYRETGKAHRQRKPPQEQVEYAE